jgi:micrococcal nuclease
MDTQKLLKFKIPKDKIIMILIVFFVFIYPAFFGNPYEINLKEDIVIELSADEVWVEHVIDGDTFVSRSGDTIRLIGIDTPEKDQPHYEEAKKMLEERIGDKKVRLEKDVSETDKYNRLLRYVYVDDVFINRILIEEGLARALTLPPDVKYVDEIMSAQESAKNNNRGLWQ